MLFFSVLQTTLPRLIGLVVYHTELKSENKTLWAMFREGYDEEAERVQP